MPLGNPTAGFNIGHDCTVNVINPMTGVPINLGNVTSFDSKQVTKQLESTPISAPPIFGETFHGWDGSFSVDRSNSNVDDLFAAMEQAFWTTGSNITNGTITEYIQELNGVISQYTYTNCVFSFGDAGSKQSQNKIMLKLSFRASRRLKVV